MATKKEPEIFEAAEYASKIDSMIKNLRSSKKPGAPAGTIRKNEVLALRRIELQKLIEDGYTVHQIAEAMKAEVFNVLPKTITEIVQNKTKAASVTTAAKKQATRKTAKATMSAITSTTTEQLDLVTTDAATATETAQQPEAAPAPVPALAPVVSAAVSAANSQKNKTVTFPDR